MDHLGDIRSRLTALRKAPIWASDSVGADAVHQLRALLANIHGSIDQVHVSAATAREAVTSLVDEEASGDRAVLIAAIDTGEARKISSLESEAVAVDEALGALLELCTTVDEALVTGSSSLAELEVSLQALLESFQVYRHSPVEPIPIIFLPGSFPATDQSNRLGRVYVSKVHMASSMQIIGLPGHGRPGHSAQCKLQLDVSCDALFPEDESFVVADVLRQLYAEAVAIPVDDCAAEEVLTVRFSPDSASPSLVSVILRVDIPAHTKRYTKIALRRLTLAGQLVPEADAFSQCAWLVYTGLLAPQVIALNDRLSDRMSVAVSPDGSFYIASVGQSAVEHVSNDGHPLRSIKLEALGLSSQTGAVGIVDDGAALVLADHSDTGILTLVDSGTLCQRWTIPSGSFRSSCSLCVLPLQGVVVVQSFFDDNMYFHRITDGRRVLTTKPPVSVYVPVHMTADPVTGHIYQKAQGRELTRWCCKNDRGAFDAVLEPFSLEAVSSFPPVDSFGALAVVRSNNVSCQGYLVLGRTHAADRMNRATLHVFALPDVRLVHTHEIDGCFDVSGIAVDPSGDAILICDRSATVIRVLPWPLPGSALATAS